MKIHALIRDGYVAGYTMTGEIVGGQYVTVPDDIPPDDFRRDCRAYKPGEDGETLVLDEQRREQLVGRRLESAKTKKQAENNSLLASYLSAHPLLWRDGKPYGVTQEDQSEIALNLQQYRIAVAAGQPAVLEWHAVHEACRVFEEDELAELAVAISEYVYPIVRYNQSLKVQIYGASTEDELAAIPLIYDDEHFAAAVQINNLAQTKRIKRKEI